MKTIKLSDKNFKKFKKFTEEWLEKRTQLIEDCSDINCINALADHVMFDIASAIGRAE
tara:strand:- start:203 stop:376 length:174 start_codon:yes stop_codon:yes gene_type:complete